MFVALYQRTIGYNLAYTELSLSQKQICQPTSLLSPVENFS